MVRSLFFIYLYHLGPEVALSNFTDLNYINWHPEVIDNYNLIIIRMAVDPEALLVSNSDRHRYQV